jgi:hypothetical protein
VLAVEAAHAITMDSIASRMLNCLNGWTIPRTKQC